MLETDPRHAAANYGMALLIRGKDPQSALRHLDAALDFESSSDRRHPAPRPGPRAARRSGRPRRRRPSPRQSHVRRLYNAACAVSLYAEKSADAGQLPHALELLARALEAGFPASEVASDPDLKRSMPCPSFISCWPEPGNTKRVDKLVLTNCSLVVQ